MGYSQRITVKDEQGRITSSWSRVRIVVPDGLSASLPPPYTGHKNLTKKVQTDREHAECTARFLGMIDQARGWTTIHRELAEINGLSLEEFIARGSIPVFAKLDQKTDEIFGPPAWKQQNGNLEHKPVHFEEMIKLWGRGKSKQAIANTETKCGVFADWLIENAGHMDMARVTFPNGRDWRDEMIEEGKLAPGTISNHLKLVKALFNYAFGNDHIPVNHMARIKYSPGEGEGRDDFTPEERLLILTKAREAKPYIKWMNWICSFQGTRNGEIADASTLDFEFVDGFWVFTIHIKNRLKGQRLKTPVSARRIVLHQSLLDEGFIEFRDGVRRRHGDGPLFRDAPLDIYGRRAGRITTELSDWLRNTVGIEDPRKPFYSHRHTATSYLRNMLGPDGTPLVKEDIERYILGHGKKGSHAGYGKRWFETLKRSIEVIPNPL
jgi:hypothetical protein